MNKPASIRQLIETQVIESRKADRQGWIQKGWFSSGLGNCISGRYYERLLGGKEEPVDVRKQLLFATGDAFHEWVYQQVRKSSIPHEIEESLSLPALHLVGRLDMRLMWQPNHWTVYDIKTVHSKSFWWREQSGTTAQEHHLLQVTAYLMMLRKKYPKLVFDGRILYISKDDLAMSEVAVPMTTQAEEAIKSSLKTLNAAWKAQVPPKPEEDIVYQGGKWQIHWKGRYCLYHHLCTGNPNWLEDAKQEVARRNKEAAYGSSINSNGVTVTAPVAEGK